MLRARTSTVALFAAATVAACSSVHLPDGGADASDGSRGMDAVADTASPMDGAPGTDVTDAADATNPPDASGDTAPPADAPTTLAGTYAIALQDFAVTPDGSARNPEVSYAPGAGAFVAAYVWVQPDGAFRTQVRAVSLFDSAPPAVSDPVDASSAPDGVVHNSLECSVAAGGSRALVVYDDDRMSNGNGQLEIYGQIVQVSGGAAPAVSTVGPVFDISQVPVTNEWLPADAYDPVSDGYLVAWADDRARDSVNVNARVVYARRVASDGTVGPEVRLGDDTPFQNFPQVAAGGGKFLAVWSDFITPDGSTIVTQYQGRVLDGATGQPVSGIFTLISGSGAPHDLPAVAYNSARGEWLAAWTGGGPPNVRQVYAAAIGLDGTVRRAAFALTAQPEGAGSPRLAYSALTNSYLVTFHAQDSNDASGMELGPDGSPAGAPRSLNPTPPPLGTFYTAVAADGAAPRYLALRNTDYARIRGTVFSAPMGLSGAGR